MSCFKWIRALLLVGFFFFITPNSTATDTSSLLQATQYASSVSNFPLQSLIASDTYLGGSFKIGMFDWAEDAWDAVSDGVGEAWDAASNAITDAANAAAAALETAWKETTNALTNVATKAGDALKTAGLATANYIKNNPEMMGMIAGAIVLTIVTGGTASPALAAMLGGGTFVSTLVSAGTIAASTYGFYQAQKTAKDIVFAVKDGEYLNAGILSAQLVGDIAGVGALSNMADNMDAAQDLYNAVSEGDFEAIAKNTLKLGSGLTGSNLYNNAIVSAKIINAVNDGDYGDAALLLTELQADHKGVSDGLAIAQFGVQAKEAIQNLQAASKAEQDDPSPENQAALALAKEEAKQQILIEQFGTQLNTAMQNAQAAATAARTNSTPASRAALALAQSQLQATVQAQATKAQLQAQLNISLNNLQAAAAVAKADPSAANQAALVAAQNDATAKAQALEANSTTQLNAIVANLPEGSPTENIVQGTALIQEAAKQGTLSTTAQTNLSQWLVANPSSASITFLAAALDFNSYYTKMLQANAAAASTPSAENTAAASAANAAYTTYISALTPQVMGALMGFVSDNKMNTDTTLLSNQSLFLLDPYQFYLAEEADAEQSNLKTISASGVTMNSEVTVNIPSNYAASQMAQLMAALTPTQRKELLNSFYGSALSLGDTTAVSTFNQYIATDGTIISSALATTQMMTAQQSADSTTASVAVITAQLTAAQQAQTGYKYSHYSDANDTTLLQAESSIPPVSGNITADNIQNQIATSALSDTAKQNLSNWVQGNTADPNAVNTAAATLQYTQLFNAAYGSGNSNNTAALQAFANYFNTLPNATAVAMTNFAVQQGLINSQSALLVTNPAQYLVNQMTAVKENNSTLYTLLSNLYQQQSMLTSSVMSGFNPYISSQAQRVSQATIATFSGVNPPYEVSNPQAYAMAQLYNATQYWSQAQLKALGAQAYYGSILNNNGLTSTVQSYLTPAGTYQNNPQNIMSQQERFALGGSLYSPYKMTPAAFLQALINAGPRNANNYIATYSNYLSQNYAQAAQSPFGSSRITPNYYGSAIALYFSGIKTMPTSANTLEQQAITAAQGAVKQYQQTLAYVKSTQQASSMLGQPQLESAIQQHQNAEVAINQ